MGWWIIGKYRVTHLLESNLLLTTKQKFSFGLARSGQARSGQARPIRNLCFDVNGRFESTRHFIHSVPCTGVFSVPPSASRWEFSRSRYLAWQDGERPNQSQSEHMRHFVNRLGVMTLPDQDLKGYHVAISKSTVVVFCYIRILLSFPIWCQITSVGEGSLDVEGGTGEAIVAVTSGEGGDDGVEALLCDDWFFLCVVIRDGSRASTSTRGKRVLMSNARE